MEEHKVIIVVVILGITAIVMMGLVAKIALLETQVANAPRMHDNLRRQSVPKPKDNPPASNSRSGEARAASPGSSENGNPTNGAAQPSSPYGRKSPPQDAPQASSQPSSAPSAPPGRAAEEAFAEAENSIVRLTAVDHKEEKNGIAVAIREGGVLLSGAPLLSGAYEGWCMLPKSRQKTPPFNRCITYSPESYLALVRVDYKDEPLGPLPVASALPGKGDRVRAYCETGQIDVGRADATVESLLSSGDVEKKLQLTAPSTGDGVWIELLGTFPRNTFGSPVLNQAGELVGVVLLDSQGSGPKASTSGFGGGSTSAIPATSMRRVYAISSDALAPLLAQAASPANEVLFTMTVAPLQRPSRPAAGQWSVRLASGETIDEKSFAASAAGNLGTLTYPGGGRCATLALSERKTIDGLLTIYTSDGKELLRESMVQGRRQGPLTVWTAAGKCILAAQFERDVRHGYAAYFRDGAPWLIQEHREGTLEVQHLVKQGAVFHTVPSGKTVPTITSVLAQYGEWPQWEAGLKAMESAIERWAKEADRHQRAGRTRLNPDQLNAAQRDAVVAIEEFRKLAL